MMVDNWTRVIVQKDMPSPRTFHKAVVVSKYMYIVGGFDGEKLNDIWRLDASKLCYESWEKKTVNNPIHQTVMNNMDTHYIRDGILY